MLIKEICTPDVVCCAPTTTATAAARLMRDRHVGNLIVVDDPDGDHTPIGVITDRDLVVEVLGRELDPAATPVHEIMHTPVVVADATDDTSQVIERMRAHGVRRVPVMGEHRKLIGVVSLDDLMRQIMKDTASLVEVVSKEQDRERRTRRSA